MKSKRNYKDSVFVDLFGKCKDARANFLSLYNAIQGTDLKLEDTEVRPITLKQTIYTGKYNDVSMIINNKLIVLVEQQSTINENMPLRFLGYIAKIYDKLVKSDDRYKRRLIKLPKPEFYVIYNGMEKYPASNTLYLSDAFIDFSNDFDYGKITLEIIVKVFNINEKDDNQSLLKCIPLSGYSRLVELVNEGMRLGLANPIDSAVKQCIREKVLSDYLKENSTEVRNMTFGEYNYETDIRVQRQEAMEEGSLDKSISIAKNMLSDGKLSHNDIASYTGLSLEKIQELAKDLSTR